ncbi:MAG: hypothetical protein FJX76_11725 [Armatimonadetes bacterium]|nr:hypothetical protein [Armatimonadota bacterium]
MRFLDDLTEADAVGGKAWSCARLRRLGLPVPDGFVVTSADPGPIAEAVARFPAGTRFAVRSSAAAEDGAAHSFAGIYESVLDVAPEDVPAAVARCLLAVDSARATVYREASGIGADRMAVLVQRMVFARAAGVAFTADPLSGDADTVVIEAGASEEVVGGAIRPHTWRVRNGTTDADGTLLSDAEVAALAVLARRAGPKQDVEWCLDESGFWIVQARPITTRDGVHEADVAVPPAVRPGTEWTRANVREVLPDMPSPQAMEVLGGICNDGMARLYGRLSDRRLGPMVVPIYGRPYFNLSQFRYFCKMTHTPFEMVTAVLGDAAGTPLDADPAPTLLERVLAMPDLLRMLGLPFTLARRQRALERMIAEWLGVLRAQRPAEMSDEAIWTLMSSWQARAGQAMEAVLALGVLFSFPTMIDAVCRRVGFPGDQLRTACLAAGSKTVSGQQALDHMALAVTAYQEDSVRAWMLAPVGDFREALAGTRFLVEFEAFLARYGHRGTWESDWSLPRMREDPTAVLVSIAAAVRAGPPPSPNALRARQDDEARRLWSAFVASLRGWRRWIVPPLVSGMLRATRFLYQSREKNRSDMHEVLGELRQLHLELARRCHARGHIESVDDYFQLSVSEVSDVTGAAGWKALVRQRKARRAAWKGYEMPLYLTAEDARAGRFEGPAHGEEPVMCGLCVSAGFIEAEVVVVHTPDQIEVMRSGAILVTTATDPSWTPFFTLAAGVIVEIGGTLSHASTIARELSLPALANVAGATKRLRTGQRVRLDATNGRVEVVE